MRNDHLFYGHIGGAYPLPRTSIPHREARRMRAGGHGLLRDALPRLASVFRRAPPKLRAAGGGGGRLGGTGTAVGGRGRWVGMCAQGSEF